MNALLLAAMLGQDPEVVLSARAKKGAEGYELHVRGDGPALSDEAKVSLRFRRMVNRLDWADGSITTVPLDPPWIRSASAAQGTFSTKEIFRGPAEVAIEVVVETPEGGARTPVSGVVRVAPGHEVAGALRRDAHRAAAALEAARERLEEMEAIPDAACPGAARHLGRLRRQLERQRSAWAQEAGGTLLSATAPHMDGFLADLSRALEGVASGKGAESGVSGLSGEPLSSAELRKNLDLLQRVAVREQALVLLRETQETRREIGQAAATGCPFRWARIEESAVKSLTAIREFEKELRTGPQGPWFAEVTGCESGPSIEEILEGTQNYLDIASSAVVCPRSSEGEMERTEYRLNDRGALLEQHLRGLK